MAKQKLGDKKTAKIEAFTGRKVHVALTRGGYPHFVAEVWFRSGEPRVAYVNYRTGQQEEHPFDKWACRNE